MISNKKVMWFIFGLMVCAQLLTPAQMIYAKHLVKLKGITYKFELQAIDPSDPFRGKYIILRPKSVDYTTRNPEAKLHGNVCASLETDSLGYAKITALSTAAPDHTNYLKVDSYQRSRTDTSMIVRILYPFDRYYMNEHKSLPAERLTRAAVLDSTKTCYAEVAIYNGQFSLISVKINDEDIENLIEN